MPTPKLQNSKDDHHSRPDLWILKEMTNLLKFVYVGKVITEAGPEGYMILSLGR